MTLGTKYHEYAALPNLVSNYLNMNFYIPLQLTELSKKLTRPIYIVGGFVRNQLCGLALNADIDIAGGFDAESFKAVKNTKVIPVNKKLGTALIFYKGGKFEYTPFRKENYAEGGSHSPEAVEFNVPLDEDARRRDFTANSIYLDASSGNTVDPLNGIADAKNKILRAFDPCFVFKSDGLRLMRLARLAAELGFSIDSHTAAVAKEFNYQLRDIAAERKREELDKILNADSKYGIKDAHYQGLKELTKLGLWRYILPSMTIMEIPQNPKWHNHDVLEHTFLAVKYAPPGVRLAALMHDTGKPVCMLKYGKMHGHADESALIAQKELGQTGLKYPSAVADEVAALCRLHMYDLKLEVADAKMRVFCAVNFEYIDRLQELAAADGQATGKENLYTPRFAEFKQRLIQDGAPITKADLKIDGRDAVAYGYKGAQISAIIEELWRECVIEPKLNNREWLSSQLESRRFKQ